MANPEFKATREGRIIELKTLPVQDILTSELVQLSASGDNSKYEQELQHRFSLLGLTDKQQKMFIDLDLFALEKKDPRIREKALAIGYYILAPTTVESLPDPNSCLTSELIMITDDAEVAGVEGGYEWLSDEALKALNHVIGKHFDEEKQDWILDENGPYMKELERRFDLIGLEEWQRILFIKNEGLIAARAKWGDKFSEMSWTQAPLELELDKQKNFS